MPYRLATPQYEIIFKSNFLSALYSILKGLSLSTDIMHRAVLLLMLKYYIKLNTKKQAFLSNLYKFL